MEALAPFQKGMSFLCIGSGTGYILSIAARLVGPGAVCHGVEIWKDLVESSRTKTTNSGNPIYENIEIFHGNCYSIDIDKTDIRYDRIYVGAGAGTKARSFLRLLRVGGVMVGPFTSVTGAQELQKLTRTSLNEFQKIVLKPVAFAPLLSLSEEMQAQEFDRMAPGPRPVVLRERVWTPEKHKLYTPDFKKSIFTILMIANRRSGSSSVSQVPIDMWVSKIFCFFGVHFFEKDLDRAEEGGNQRGKFQLTRVDVSFFFSLILRKQYWRNIH
jgi:protein-L-isoaspartate O-methyltransferase